MVSGVDEWVLAGLVPADHAPVLARLTCRAVAGRDGLPDDGMVLGCDSVRTLAVRGRSGVLHTGHCLRTSAGEEIAEVAWTTGHFAFVTRIEGDPHHVWASACPCCERWSPA